MTRNIFFSSDPHLFHENFLTFEDDNGQLIRPFASVEEMNEKFVDGCRSVMRDGDIFYLLGDVTFDYSEKFDALMSRIPGSKRLLLGNHDKIKGTSLLKHFKKVGLWRVFTEYDFTCSHIPLRLDQLRKTRFNVHGHIHQNVMDDPHYINVCVEQTNYVPMALEEIQFEICRRLLNMPANDNKQEGSECELLAA